ncbi:MAG TPA: hypothetical protein VI776_09435 [Anaerolineales bacterium]|nr:hypothetical protein [Anaerolineales bacterium]
MVYPLSGGQIIPHGPTLAAVIVLSISEGRWYDVLLFETFAFRFIITWLYIQTGGSVLIVMLFHLSSNILGGGMMVPLFSGADQARYYQLFVGFACLVALVLLLSSRQSLGEADKITSAGSPGSA